MSQVTLFENLINMFDNKMLKWAKFVFHTCKLHNIILLSTPGCIQETDIDYSLGDDNDIGEAQGFTQQGCAQWAAATDGALFWTYNSYQNRCYLKKTDGGRKQQLYAGLVSGNKACGGTGLVSNVIRLSLSFPRFIL